MKINNNNNNKGGLNKILTNILQDTKKFQKYN